MTYEEALKLTNDSISQGHILPEQENYSYMYRVQEALENQIPKETIEDGYNGGACACPSCGWAFAFDKESKAEIIKMDMYHYCPECGQAIKWE